MSEMSTEKVSGGVFARVSSGLVRTVSTFDTFFYCLVQLAVTFVFFQIAFSEGPLNPGRIASISNSTVPRAKMSTAGVTRRPRICSGAMYGAFPETISSSGESTVCAMPKSPSFTSPRFEIKMFDGPTS